MIINTHNNNNNNQSERSDKSNQKYHDYVDALEEERHKVQVFQRELPLCLELVTQAIETWKQRLTGTATEQNNLSECSEQTSSPILEEFIPIHRANSSHSVDEEQEPKKSDWLRSVQLWNQTPDPPPKQDSPRKSSVLEVKSNGSGGAFHPFKKGKSIGGGEGDTAAVPPPSTSSTADTGGGSKKEEKEGQSQRKTRRCWSPELHKRFLRALQQLGGSQVATPKQIRELMKVDGLTNDEVKSHLQKYRLHTRRPSSSSHNNNSNNNTQTPQFVVVGGIWVPPEYTAAAATTKSEAAGGGASFNGIYAPVATLPPPFRETSPSPSPSPKQRHNKSSSRDSGDIEGGDQSYSPASSSSTHKTNVSPAC